MEVTLGDAVALCRRIEAAIKPFGAHCALTGSCLYTGYSEKDIDVMIYSHQGISALRFGEDVQVDGELPADAAALSTQS